MVEDVKVNSFHFIHFEIKISQVKLGKQLQDFLWLIFFVLTFFSIENCFTFYKTYEHVYLFHLKC